MNKQKCVTTTCALINLFYCINSQGAWADKLPDYHFGDDSNYSLHDVREDPFPIRHQLKDEQSKHECDGGCVALCWGPAGNYSSGLQQHCNSAFLKGSWVPPNINGNVSIERDECGFWMADFDSTDLDTNKYSTWNCFLCLSNRGFLPRRPTGAGR